MKAVLADPLPAPWISDSRPGLTKTASYAEKLRDDIQSAKERREQTPSTLDNADFVVKDFGDLAMGSQEDLTNQGAKAGVEATPVHNTAFHAKRFFGLPDEDETPDTFRQTRACQRKRIMR